MNAIQPCALLLLIGPDWQIETVSANAGMIGDQKPAAMVGQPLIDLIGTKAIHGLRNRMSWLSNDESEVQDFGVEWGDVALDIRATHEGENYLIEAELSVEPRLPDAIGIVRSMADRLDSNDPVQMAGQAMRQLSALTGFEQLLLVDKQGTEVASAQRGRHSTLRCPHVATPRVVADRDAEPVPLIGDSESRLISRAAYAAPGIEEKEWLAEGEVAAAVMLPLRIDGEQVATLHGLHPMPRRCGLERRSAAHLFAERLVARMSRFGWRP